MQVPAIKKPKLNRCNAMDAQTLKEELQQPVTTITTATPGLPEWDSKMIQLSSATAQMLVHAIEQNTMALQKLSWEFDLLTKKRFHVIGSEATNKKEQPAKTKTNNSDTEDEIVM